MVHPMTTSSTRAGSRSLRASRAASGWAARSVACQPERRPPRRPTGVRTASTITALGIGANSDAESDGCQAAGHRRAHRRPRPTLAIASAALCQIRSAAMGSVCQIRDAMDLTFSPEHEAFRAEARAWLAAHVPADPLPSLDTADGFEAHRRLGAHHVRGPLVGGELAHRVRRPRRRHLRVARLRGGVLPRPGAQAGEPERHLPARPHHARVRDRRAEGALPPADGRRATRSGARAGPSPTPAATSPASARAPSRNAAGDGWVLNGQKTWASRGAFAEWCFGIFRTDPEAERHRGLTYFLVAMDSPGRHGAPDPPDRRRDRLRRDLLRQRRGPRGPGARRGRRRLVGRHGDGRLRARPLAAQPGPLHRGGRPPRRALRAARRPGRVRRRRRPGPHGRRGLQAAHLLDGDQGGPRPRGRPGGQLQQDLLVRDRRRHPHRRARPARPRRRAPRGRRARASGSTAISSRWPGPSTPGPTRSSATWWPSACSGCRGAERTGRGLRVHRRAGRAARRACARCSTPSARPTRCAPSSWPTRRAGPSWPRTAGPCWPSSARRRSSCPRPPAGSG